MATEFTVDIVSPEGVAWSGSATFLVARTPDGEIGVMAGHEALMAALVGGTVSVDAADGGRTSVDVEGGFLQILNNQVTLITDRAVISDGKS